MKILPMVLLLSLGPNALVTAQGVDPALYESMKWRNIGPFRGGRSNASTGVIQDPRTFYFGGVGGGVWKTTDGGETWNNVSDGFFETASVGAIAVAPSDPNVVYVGMGEHAVRGVMTSHGDGVYKSTDAGRTWTHVGLPRSRAISRIRVHPADPDRVYVAVQGAPYGPSEDRGVYRSMDGGANWKRVLYVSEDAGAADLDMDPANPRILYAALWDHRRTPWQVRSGGPGSGIHKSMDGGETWVEIGNGEKGLPVERGKMSVAVSANSDRIYVLVEADPGGGLYRSEDAGESFELVNETWTIRARAWYYIKVFADPKNEDVVWVTNAPLLKSIDGGKTFSRVATPHGDNHHLWIHPEDPDVMINSNDGGANVSTNGGKSWSTQRNQPTAQLYRVDTDHRFPYYVYGGQQDNTSVAIASQSFDGGGIGWKDWYPVGGCESAFAAFDRDDPSRVYAGCYMGQISEWDARTRSARNVMAYPMLPAAMASREMKYRFNWNAPIVVSQHDPGVIYHAANVLLRTTNGGVSWSEVSPDLTRDDDEKQGLGGGPITNEGAGGEIYGTIAYVAESPHDARVLWIGTDDGYVQVTRDGGSSWQNVTPDGIGEALINAIDVSPHEPGAAYIALTRYKFNDFTPLAYKTTDYGESWAPIVNGIADEAWVRVVREDPVRRGLLYMGTETGAYVSFDDGEQWQSLQLNLPVVPVTDLRVQRRANDLVAATQGRSFWILDELSPMQQLNDDIENGRAHLFAPGPATRVQRGVSFASQARTGQNPPEGAILDYVLDEVDEGLEEVRTVTLEILDAGGKIVRSYSSEDEEDDDDTVLWTEPGMHRLSWDLRHETPKKVPGLYVFGRLRGRLVPPGSYRVRLSVDDEVLTRGFEVLSDPRLDTPLADYVEQDVFLATVATQISAIHESVNRLRDVRDQVEALLDRSQEHELAGVVREAGEAYVEKLDAMEDELIQKRTVDGQTVINFPTRLNQHYIYLHAAVDGSDSGVLEGARERFRDLQAEWRGLERQVEELLGPELDAFNTLVRDTGIPAVIAGVSL